MMAPSEPVQTKFPSIFACPCLPVAMGTVGVCGGCMLLTDIFILTIKELSSCKALESSGTVGCKLARVAKHRLNVRNDPSHFVWWGRKPCGNKFFPPFQMTPSLTCLPHLLSKPNWMLPSTLSRFWYLEGSFPWIQGPIHIGCPVVWFGQNPRLLFQITF